MQSNSFTHQRPYARVMVILAVLLALIVSALPGTSYAEGEWTLLNGMVTAINDGPGDQRDANISGNLVSYANINGGASDVHYYNLITGTDTGIPQEEVSLDWLSNIDGTNIVYTHIANNSYEINFYDTNTGGNSVTLDPQPSSEREKPSIGGQTVAWVDFGLNDNNLYISEIVTYDRVTGVTTRLTNDEFYDTDPSVSPDGSLIIWSKCQVNLSNCHTWQATYNGNDWDVAPLAGNGNQLHPATDGQYIVYYSNHDNNTSDRNIFWQLRGINEEHELVLPGTQRNPSIDNGLVVFENFDTNASIPNWDLMLYDLNHDRGFRVTDTDVSEILPDIAVASDGMMHVVWMQVTTDADIFASTFRLPEVGNNQPPVIDHITAPVDPMVINSTVPFTANFSDPDFADTHTAVWEWGDGNTESGLISEANGTGTVSGSHAYANPGVYGVTLTVTDNYDAADTEIFQYVVVYNPTGGFVTGSGWLDSPAGAYTSNPSLTGKAHFGFVSRYQKGASLPSGNTEFQFKAGDISFRSIAYDWLVIAGAKAQFKGVGTINGSGSYGFLLTVTDGQVTGGGSMDKFRIKLWDRETGIVVYDSQLGADEIAEPNTAIGGGSIVIHK